MQKSIVVDRLKFLLQIYNNNYEMIMTFEGKI
jgi:hypothetical protein